ncbi:MAG: hypothetical protein AAFX79_11430 [Planctomycetota bacterium]
MADGGAWRATRAAAGEDGPAWARALEAEPWRDAARALKVDGDTRVLAATLRNRAVVLKFGHLGVRARAIKARLGLSPADRNWAGAALLAAEGIPCARMLALLAERPSPGTPPRQCLISAFEPGETLLHYARLAHAGELAFRRQRRLARAVGLHVGCILAGDLYNRDSKPSNLIVRWDDDAPGDPARDIADDAWPSLTVVDCQGVRRLVRKRAYRSMRMQASLILEPMGLCMTPRRPHIARTLRATMAAYAARRYAGVPVEAALRLDLKAEHELLASIPERAIAGWHRIAERIRVHGDPTPRVDPLAEPDLQ